MVISNTGKSKFAFKYLLFEMFEYTCPSLASFRHLIN